MIGAAALVPATSGVARALPSSASAPATADATNGDLIVPAGSTVTIQTPTPGGTYYQGGNITVDAGGTLIVENTTISFVQYVTNGASLAVEFSHIYHFSDAGTVEFIDSGIISNTNVQNFSAKIFVGVTGTLEAWDSTFEFPGWIEVSGAGAVATFNDSLINRDPAIAADSYPTTNLPTNLLGDEEYAPVLNVSAGAELNLLGTDYLNTYSDNWTLNGAVSPVPEVVANGLSLPTTGATFGSGYFALTPDDPYAVAAAALYPSEANLVSVSITYTAGTGTASVGVLYGGTTYHLGTASFAAGSGTDTLTAGVGSPLITAMMTEGLPLYANQSIVFSAVTATGAVSISQMTVSMTPDPSFNLTAWGSGSRINALNSLIDVNFVPSYYNLSAPAPVFVWDSNKVGVYDGAEAFLANISFVVPAPANFSTSPILTDATSEAFLYRWAQFNLEGQAAIHVADAKLTPFYAYNSGQTGNATANAANDLATASPAIWGYVNYWDGLHGVPSYGTSNVGGAAWLLLADSQLTGTSLPDGNYLGNYHVGVSLPSSSLAPVWLYAAVSPYPQGVANSSPGYAAPDVQPTTYISGYYGAASLSAPVILANGTAAPDSQVREGQVLGVQLTLVDEGTARIFNVNATLYWNDSKNSRALANFTASDLNLTTPGQNLTFVLSWYVNDSVTGLQGNFTHAFFLNLSWNYGQQQYAGGVLHDNASVVITPSTIVIVSLVPPTSPLDTSNAYVTTGVIAYNGTQSAAIFITATPVGGGSPVTIGAGTSFPGKFVVYWSSLSTLLTPGTTYYLKATATYNGASTTKLFPGTYSVPSTTSATGFLDQKILGLPLWLWLAIAAAVVIAIVAVLWIFRRQAAGKLVECGECGELIPEDATVCPKCGAEFENDLVRCSRCSATIPANSQFCPECGAQLLGKPGEGESDPERQAYADFTERFRTEAKKELGDNYTESAFWDWWKRQPSYVPFSQWKAQQAQGAPRAGMSQPPTGTEVSASGGPGSAPAARPAAATMAAPAAGAPAPAATAAAPPLAATTAPASGLKPCPSCGKEIPPEYLVCPFCGAVTQ